MEFLLTHLCAGLVGPRPIDIDCSVVELFAAHSMFGEGRRQRAATRESELFEECVFLGVLRGRNLCANNSW